MSGDTGCLGAALGLDGGFGTIAPEDPLRPTPGSWQINVSDRRCSPGEQHCRTSRRGLELDPQLSSPCRLGHHRGTARGMGSWSGTLPSKQAERPHFRTTVDIALPTMQAGQRDGPGIESHGPARLIQDRQSPHLPDNRWHCPSPPSRMGRGVRPTGPAEWYKIRLLPIHAVQPTGPVRRVRAAASAEAV